MGLFNREKKREAEQAVLQKMMKSALLDRLVPLIVNAPDFEWMRCGKNGDSGCRDVTVVPTGLIIEIPGAYKRQIEDQYFAINFEKLGYEGLSGQGLSDSKMCFLYASALRERLAAELKNCNFYSVCNDRDLDQLDGESTFFYAMDLLLDRGARAKFSYQVPVPTKNTLF